MSDSKRIITIRLSQLDKDRWQKGAKELELNLSDFVRRAVEKTLIRDEFAKKLMQVRKEIDQRLNRLESFVESLDYSIWICPECKSESPPTMCSTCGKQMEVEGDILVCRPNSFHSETVKEVLPTCSKCKRQMKLRTRNVS